MNSQFDTTYIIKGDEVVRIRIDFTKKKKKNENSHTVICNVSDHHVKSR